VALGLDALALGLLAGLAGLRGLRLGVLLQRLASPRRARASTCRCSSF
jgi:hypothetical protein